MPVMFTNSEFDPDFTRSERAVLRRLADRVLANAQAADALLEVADLADTDAVAPDDNNVLVFKTTSGNWEAESKGSVVTTNANTTVTGVLAHNGAYLQFTSNSAVGYTIPPEASVAWPDGAQIEIEQGGTGAVTISAGSGVTLNYNAALTPVTNGQYSVVGLKKTGTNTWTLFGNLVAA